MECIGSGVEHLGASMGFGHELMAAPIVGQTIGHMGFGVARVDPAIELHGTRRLGGWPEGRGSMMDCITTGLERMGLE